MLTDNLYHVYRERISNIDPSGIGEVQHQTIALMLYRAGYGQLENCPEPGDDIKLYDDGYDFEHPWSIQSRARTYAFYELKEIFGDLNTYLNMSPKVASEIVKGMRKGAEELNQLRQRQTNSQPKSGEQHDLEQQLAELSRVDLSSG